MILFNTFLNLQQLFNSEVKSVINKILQDMALKLDINSDIHLALHLSNYFTEEILLQCLVNS